jgi:Fe-S-cluster-containing dehydrogenase component
MKVTAAGLAFVLARGLYIIEKCDGCGKLLNQTLRYTVAGNPEVYCSAVCRDLMFFGDRREARKHSNPRKCVYCRANLEGKRRGALYCDEVCKKRVARTGSAQSTAEPQITGTATQSNQRVVAAKTVEQGDRITRPLHGSKIALSDPNPPPRKSAL